MILGAVVGKIHVVKGPVEAKLSLGFVAAEPPESHVKGFDVLGNNGFVDDTSSGGVVGLDGRLRLWPNHFDE